MCSTSVNARTVLDPVCPNHRQLAALSNLDSAAARKQLPQFVGYREVAESFGVSRRTIERQVEEGIIPKPLQLSPNRVGWPIDQITGVLDKRAKGLMALAVSRPEDLAIDQVAPTMRELGARLISDKLGETIRSEQVTIRIEKKRLERGSDELPCRVS